jgi:hypothetical protein
VLTEAPGFAECWARTARQLNHEATKSGLQVENRFVSS